MNESRAEISKMENPVLSCLNSLKGTVRWGLRWCMVTWSRQFTRPLSSHVIRGRRHFILHPISSVCCPVVSSDPIVLMEHGDFVTNLCKVHGCAVARSVYKLDMLNLFHSPYAG